MCRIFQSLQIMNQRKLIHYLIWLMCRIFNHYKWWINVNWFIIFIWFMCKYFNHNKWWINFNWFIISCGSQVDIIWSTNRDFSIILCDSLIDFFFQFYQLIHSQILIISFDSSIIQFDSFMLFNLFADFSIIIFDLSV